MLTGFSSLTVGAIASATFMGVTAIAEEPTNAATNWQAIYKRGASIMPKVAGAVAVLYGYAAYDVRSNSGPWGPYAGAAASVLAIVPWTLVVMNYTNACLAKMAQGKEETKGWNLGELLRRWNILNMARSCFPLIASILALTNLINQS